MAHVVAFVYGLNVPGAHGVGASVPTEQKVPSGQITHSSTLRITSSDVFMCVPPGHGSGADAPSSQ